MALVIYLDETGDHSLATIDRDFPVFVLTMFVVDTEEYVARVVPLVNRLKFDYFGHEAIVLHSRDIRKAQNDFRFLQIADTRQPFYDRINDIMSTCDYKVIAVAIRKEEHKKRYGKSSEDPYELALKYAMERLVPVVERAGQREVTIVAEARGKNEDDALRLSFLQVTTYGTFYLPASRFNQFTWKLVFVPKAMNVVGHQLADLIGYPIARRVIDPSKTNPAFEIVKGKFCAGARYGWYGFKVFP